MTDDEVVEESSTDPDTGAAADAVDGAVVVPLPAAARRLPLSDASPVRLATIIGLVVVLGLGALCGWLGYRAHQARQAEQLRALFVQVGKQGAVNLTTIDFEHADDDVKRILDSATGEFYDDTKRYIDRAALTDEQRTMIFETNVQRVFPRLRLPNKA